MTTAAAILTQPIHVLLVEDNPGDARLIIEMLMDVSATDFALQHVDRLDTALDRLGKSRVDVVLLDLGLPDSAGLETFARTRRGTTTQPIIVISGLDDEQLGLASVRAGAQDYLVKGRIDGQLLARVVRYAIERKRGEAQIRESERRFRQLTDNMHEVFFVEDAQLSEMLYISPAYEEIWGKTCQSLYENPRSFMDPIPLEDRERLFANIAQAQAGETPEDVEFRLVRSDGTTRWVLARSVPIRNEQGGVYRIAGVVSDITERRRADDLIRQLTKAVEQSPAGVLITDTTGTIEYVNRKFSELTGYSGAEAIGKNPRILQSGKTAPEVYRELWAKVTAGEEWSGVFQNRHKNGHLWWNAATVSPIRDADGSVTHFLAIQQDVTKQRELEDQYRQAQKMEAVGRLAGGVAHDFNNLLTVISSYSELLMEDLPAADETRRADLGLIKKAAGDAAGLTRQLLAFSRQQVLESKVLDLNAIVTGAAKMLQRVIGEDITLSWVLAPDLGRVSADPGQIEQVIMNLAVNARDAMPQGGKLTIETANAELDSSYARDHPAIAPGRYVQLVVSDTGVGMSEDIKRRIFEPFFTTKELGKGTGLGLATVYGIVKQSNGFVWIYSEPGQGATFKVYLPQVAKEPGEDQSLHAAKRPATGTETVLLAEDSAPVRAVARQILERHGYTVLEAPNGRAALDIVTRCRDPIHLLLTDVVMPEMSGRQLADQLTAQRPEVKVLFVSGYTDDSVVRHGVLEAGIAYLQKPFTPDALARKVRDVLDGKR